MDVCASHDPWDLPVRDLRALLGDRTPQLVVERYDDTCVVTGFYSLDAEILLKFCRKWRLHLLIQFEPSANHTWKSFKAAFSADPFTIETDPETEDAVLDYTNYTPEEIAIIKPMVAQFTGAKELRVVLFPKVIHLQMWPQLGITGNTLQDLTNLSGVTKARIGGATQCLEVIFLSFCSPGRT